MMRASALLVITASLSTRKGTGAPPSAPQLDVEQRALLEPVPPLQHPTRAGVELAAVDLGEEAQVAQVDAEDGTPRAASAPRPAACRRRRAPPPGRASAAGERRLSRGRGSEVARRAPRRGPRGAAIGQPPPSGGVGAARLGDHAERWNCAVRLRPASRRFRGTAPTPLVPPGAGHRRVEDASGDAQGGDTARALLIICATASSRRMPPLPTAPRPASNCGLTSASSGRRAQAAAAPAPP